MMYRHASEDDAKSHANVPAGEEGGIGCASLVVGSEVDEHRLHAWPYMPVAEAYDEGCAVVANGIFEQCENKEAEHADEYAVADILHNLALPQGASADEAREYQTAAENGEPCASACGHAEFLLAVESEIVGKHSV